MQTTDYIKLQHSFPKDCQSVFLPLSSGKGKQKQTMEANANEHVRWDVPSSATKQHTQKQQS